MVFGRDKCAPSNFWNIAERYPYMTFTI